MGLDVYTYFFYGIPFDGRMFRQRDADNGLRRCPKCERKMESEFCPKDGTPTVPIESKPGADVLYSMKTVQLIHLDDEEDDNAYLAVKASVKYVNPMRCNDGGAIRLGTAPQPDPGWNETLADACRKLEIEFDAAAASFFCATRMSY